MKFIKKVIGVDVSKDSLAICFGTLDDNQQQRISKAYSFSNNIKGFTKLLRTLSQKNYFKSSSQDTENIPVWVVMEATGIYYENFAYYLLDKGYWVSVILPNKAKHFFKTLDNKSKTDKLDASALTQFGLEKQLPKFNPPSRIMKDLKELTREYHNLIAMTTQIKNKLHAKKYSYQSLNENVKRLKEHLNLLKKQIRQIKKQIEDFIKSDKELYCKLKKIQTIKGIALITAVTLISETNGFALIRNQKQLTSYAGFDVVQNQSGKFFGKTRISKKGNKFIRKALYFPALSAARWNDKFKKIYRNLCIKKIFKKIALMAIARKLLLLVYTLWKKNEEYIPNYGIVK